MGVGDSQLVQHVVFAGVGGGVDLSAEVAGDLDGGLTDPAGAGVDQHPLPGSEPAELDQGDDRRSKTPPVPRRPG